MTDSLLGPIQDLFMWLAVIGGGLLVTGAAIALAPRLIGRLRQRSYDHTAADELVRVELTPARSGEIDAAAATAVIRGLHSRQRRGFDRWRVGWPSSELRVVWRDGDLHWQVEGHRQVLDEFALSHRALHLVTDARPVERAEPPAVATAVARLARPSSWPLRVADVPGDRVIHRLAAALEAAPPAGVEVRFRVQLRPVPPDAWRQVVDPEPSGSRSIGSLIGEAILDGLLFRESGSGRASAAVRRASRPPSCSRSRGRRSR